MSLRVLRQLRHKWDFTIHHLKRTLKNITFIPNLLLWKMLDIASSAQVAIGESLKAKPGFNVRKQLFRLFFLWGVKPQASSIISEWLCSHLRIGPPVFRRGSSSPRICTFFLLCSQKHNGPMTQCHVAASVYHTIRFKNKKQKWGEAFTCCACHYLSPQRTSASREMGVWFSAEGRWRCFRGGVRLLRSRRFEVLPPDALCVDVSRCD